MFLGGPSTAVHSVHGGICSHSGGYSASVRRTWMHASTRSTVLFTDWKSRELTVNPLMGTLKLQSNEPLYRNTVIGALAVDGWAVTFTARRGLRGPPVPSSLYQMCWCGTIYQCPLKGLALAAKWSGGSFAQRRCPFVRLFIGLFVCRMQRRLLIAPAIRAHWLVWFMLLAVFLLHSTHFILFA